MPATDDRETLTQDDLAQLVAEWAERAPDPDAFVAEFERRLVASTDRPVDIRTFVEDPDFLDASAFIFPAVMEGLIEATTRPWVEHVLTGGLASAKTTIAVYLQAYSVYLLSKLPDPHAEYDLDPTSEIQIIFQSKKEEDAAEVGYARFRALVERSPYFNEEFPFDRRIKTKTVFPNRIEVKPVVGAETGAIGRNAIGGVIDELNFMAVVQRNTRTGRGVAETYDQAKALYNALANRRLLRFQSHGEVPGYLCLVSSRNVRGQFLDQKVEEARENPGRIFVWDKRHWDIKPGEYGPERFRVFVGDEVRKPRILEDDEEVGSDDEHLVDEPPIELLSRYESDLLSALRDFSGYSTTAMHPFMANVEAVQACFGWGDREPELGRWNRESIFLDEWADFERKKVGINLDGYPYRNEPHAVHVDLALTQDMAGLGVACVPGFAPIQRILPGTGKPRVELLPRVCIAGMLQIRPPRGGEILFHKVREVIYALSDLGLNVKFVSFDSWQSVDSRQQLQAKGYRTQLISMDVDTKPYDAFKLALYDGRVEAPAHSKCQHELVRLERNLKNPKKPKVDHPALGSKDVADGACGAAWNITRKRMVWARWGVSLARARQMGIIDSAKRSEEKADADPETGYDA